MESSFAILAEPNRRAILSMLALQERSVGELESRLRMPQTSVSKHLRVLRDAGFVEARVEGQRRVYAIRPEPFQEVDVWLGQFRRFWNAHLDALERHLDRVEAESTHRRQRQSRKKSPDKKSPDKKSPDKKSPDKKSPDKKSPDKKKGRGKST